MGGTSSTTYRRATLADAPSLNRIAIAAYEGYVERLGKPPAPMLADYQDVIAHNHVWVALIHEDVVGMIVLVGSVDHLLIDNVAVTPAAQNLGVGSGLLALAERCAVSLGTKELRLYTNEAMSENLAFYRRHWYVETHRAISGGYRRVFFAKKLP